MSFNNSFKQKLFRLDSDKFECVALELFQHQALHNQLYNEYIQNIGVKIEDVSSIYEIPFLPIEFFKYHDIKTHSWNSRYIFESSGTTGIKTSKHHVMDPEFYQAHTLDLFEYFYGDVQEYHILALLPSYIERSNSSLIFMVDHMIKKSESNYSGFYLDDFNLLTTRLINAKNTNRKVLLIGVSFALLDLIERINIDLSGVIIMETGGMKGRRAEMTRYELHERLKKGFNVSNIHSEYGMTELFSQMYMTNNGIFNEPNTMKVLVRDINDPFSYLDDGRHGGMNIIDLANVDTCGFIETKDIGRKMDDGVEVLGRFDNSDIRGCNLMI